MRHITHTHVGATIVVWLPTLGSGVCLHKKVNYAKLIEFKLPGPP